MTGACPPSDLSAIYEDYNRSQDGPWFVQAVAEFLAISLEMQTWKRTARRAGADAFGSRDLDFPIFLGYSLFSTLFAAFLARSGPMLRCPGFWGTGGEGAPGECDGNGLLGTRQAMILPGMR